MSAGSISSRLRRQGVSNSAALRRASRALPVSRRDGSISTHAPPCGRRVSHRVEHGHARDAVGEGCGARVVGDRSGRGCRSRNAAARQVYGPRSRPWAIMWSYAVCSTPGGSGSGAPVGRSAPTGTVRVPSRSAILTLAPMPSIHAVPLRAGDARDHDRRTPVGGGALHHARAARSSLEVHDERVVGGARARRRRRGSARAHARELAERHAELVDHLRAVRAEPAAAARVVGPPRREPRRRGRRAPERAAPRWRAGARRSRRSGPCGRASPGRDPTGTRCRAGARSRRPRAAASTCRPSAASRANGFSQITCLPAAIARERELGVRVRGSGDRDRVDAVECERVVERGERERHVELAARVRACARGRGRRGPSRRSPAARSARTWVMQPNPVPTTTTPSGA